MEIEYNKRKPTICKIPFSGVTINPDGNIVTCCGSPHVSLGHISREKSLTDFINGESQGLIRDEFKKGKWPSLCFTCKSNREKGRPALVDFMGEKLPWSDDNFRNDKYDVKYLEFTPSNACNASCVTCGSKFSSKWMAIDKEAVEQGLGFRENSTRFAKNNYSMTDEDYDKILQIVPSVEQLMLKGGEPLADKRNLKLLQKIKKEKLECQITLSTNLSMMSDQVLDILKDIKNLYLSVSIDGIGEQYNWIRSTDFNDVVSKIEKYYRTTKKKLSISITLSIYNFFNVEDAIKYFTKMKSIGRINILTATTPTYVSPAMIPQHMLDRFNKKHAESIWCANNPKVTRKESLWSWTSHETLEDKTFFLKNKDRVFQWVDFLNQKRGFKIESLVPELLEIKEYYAQYS